MIKALLDWTSVAVAAGALVKVLPAIAALWTIAWLSIRMWESKTVRGWCKRGKVTQGERLTRGTRLAMSKRTAAAKESDMDGVIFFMVLASIGVGLYLKRQWFKDKFWGP